MYRCAEPTRDGERVRDSLERAAREIDWDENARNRCATRLSLYTGGRQGALECARLCRRIFHRGFHATRLPLISGEAAHRLLKTYRFLVVFSAAPISAPHRSRSSSKKMAAQNLNKL